MESGNLVEYSAQFNTQIVYGKIKGENKGARRESNFHLLTYPTAEIGVFGTEDSISTGIAGKGKHIHRFNLRQSTMFPYNAHNNGIINVKISIYNDFTAGRGPFGNYGLV